MNFKIISALLFAFVLSLGLLLVLYRMYLIIKAQKKLGKKSIDDFFMSFIYALFTLRYSVMAKHFKFQKTSAWMKIIYLLIIITLINGVFAYQ